MKRILALLTRGRLQFGRPRRAMGVLLKSLNNYPPRQKSFDLKVDDMMRAAQFIGRMIVRALLPDHDVIVVQGPFDNFRRLKFKVTGAPLT